MKINNNTWNKIRYSFYAPFYDLVANIFRASRKNSIDSLDILTNEKVLIVGAGTGLDLELISKDCEIVATDITPSMIRKIENRNHKLHRKVQTIVMDGQALDFPNDSFDKVILHLILAVIPDPVRCLIEVERVLKPGGQIAIFDKFIAKGGKSSAIRKLANVVTNFMFSDITRDFYTILSHTKLKVISDIEADFNGNYRLIKLTK